MRAALVAAVLLAGAPRAALAQSEADAFPPASDLTDAAAPAPAPAPAAELAAPAAAAPLAPAAPRVPGAAPAAAPGAAEAKGGGAYMGFSLGTGTGDVYLGDTTTSIDDLVPGVSPTTLALQLRFGWASGDLLFGFQLNLVRSQWDVSGVTSAMQLAALDVVTTLRERNLGLYVRAGIGPAQLTFEANGSSSESWNGTEAMLGVGLSHGGFGVGIDYVRQEYDGAPIDGAGYLLATVSLDFGG